MLIVALPSFLAASVFLSHVIYCASAARPIQIPWSTTTYGPDGPWQAVEVSVGSPGQKLNLYPGGVFQSHLLTLNVCKNTSLSPICYATGAGVYDPGSSSTGLDDIISYPARIDFTYGALDIQGTPAIGALDQMDIGQDIVISNVTLALHDDIAIVYPDGTAYPIEVGTFALGYTDTVNQSYSAISGPAINATLIPGYLASDNAPEKQRTPSNSFGLHIGSVTPKVPGSLYFGGYDQLRVITPVSTQNGDPVAGTIDLIDISLTVHDGASPWASSTPLTGLLQSGNTTIGPALPVRMVPEIPYLNLPASTCTAIASLLPVTYAGEFGLYLWNTSSPSYQRIVSSASSLTFTFRRDTLNTANLTINVPFSLLNLTLTAPLFAKPTPYFPCNAVSRGDYSLGRAFLQAAFFGANWDAPDGNAVWWLAQAAGPGVITQTDVKSIEKGDTTISASGNDWTASWKDFWTPLAADAVPDPITPSAVATPSSSGAATDADAADKGLSTGAMAGIGAGCGVVGLALIGAVVFLFLRRRKAKAGKQPGGTSPGEMSVAPAAYDDSKDARYVEGGFGPSELGDAGYHHHELGPAVGERAIHNNVFEMPAR